LRRGDTESWRSLRAFDGVWDKRAISGNNPSLGFSNADGDWLVSNHPNAELRQMTVAARAFDESLINLGIVRVIAGQGFCHDAVAMNHNVVSFLAE